MAATVKKSGSKKSKRNVPNGVVHIQSTFNNTIVSITDTSGHVFLGLLQAQVDLKALEKVLHLLLKQLLKLQLEEHLIKV